MIRFISRYGTFLIIPPVLAIIIIVAVKFHVDVRQEVTLVQTSATTVVAYMPPEAVPGDTLQVSSPEYGQLSFAVDSVSREASALRVSCRGSLPAADTHVTAYLICASQPIYRVIFSRL